MGLVKTKFLLIEHLEIGIFADDNKQITLQPTCTYSQNGAVVNPHTCTRNCTDNILHVQLNPSIVKFK